MNSPQLKVDWCTYEAAKFAVEHWHYSKAMPSGKLVKIGVWENGDFVGCVLFGYGAASLIGSPYGLDQTEICELVRVALRTHKTPVSRIIAISIKILRKFCPGVRLIVSFADSAQGHHGGIYQAGNWIFTGSSQYHAYRVNGKMVHPKTLHSLYGKGGQSIPWLRANVDPRAERVRNGIKHKYLFPMDENMRRAVASQSKKYPKRGISIEDASDDQSEEGGPTPTMPLKSETETVA